MSPAICLVSSQVPTLDVVQRQGHPGLVRAEGRGQPVQAAEHRQGQPAVARPADFEDHLVAMVRADVRARGRKHNGW
jgi:hypothetical protein